MDWHNSNDRNGGEIMNSTDNFWVNMSSGPEEYGDGNTELLEGKPALKRPPLYRVVLLNDDFTPMEFVVHILEVFFAMGREKATQVMLAVHTQGKGVCVIYTRDVAETKTMVVNQYSKECEHPLVCECEPVLDDE